MVPYREQGDTPKVVPTDSPVGRMLRNWKNNPKTKGKDRKKMAKYCVLVWTKEPNKGTAAFWPKYEPDED